MRSILYEQKAGHQKKVLECIGKKSIALAMLRNMFENDKLTRRVEWLDNDRYIDQGNQCIWGVEKLIDRNKL